MANKYAKHSKAGFLRQCLGARRAKVGFVSEKEAVESIGLITTTGKTKVPQKAYRCGVCDLWHLTSRP